LSLFAILNKCHENQTRTFQEIRQTSATNYQTNMHAHSTQLADV